MCCGATPKQNRKSSKTQTPLVAETSVLKQATKLTAQIAQQLAIQQKMKKKNPNAYLSRFQ